MQKQGGTGFGSQVFAQARDDLIGGIVPLREGFQGNEHAGIVALASAGKA